MASMMSDFAMEERRRALEQVEHSPYYYLTLDESLKSDPEICRVTLMAHVVCYNRSDVVLEILYRLPNFSDHKAAFLRSVRWGNSHIINTYYQRFGSEILYSNTIKEAFQEDCDASFFSILPHSLRKDRELLGVAVDLIPELALHKFIKQVPSEVLLAHGFILLRALERYANCFEHHIHDVPKSVWNNCAFVTLWLKKGGSIPLLAIPKEYSNDRELCLSLYYNKKGDYDLSEHVRWMSKSFLADKGFVLECLQISPKIYEYCVPKLRNDCDVLLEAAIGAAREKSFNRFKELLGESLILLTQVIRSRIMAYEGFMAFLGCCWASRQVALLPLNVIDCDNETGRGLKSVIAKYLGVPTPQCLDCLKTLWDEIIQVVIGQKGKLSARLAPLIQAQALVKGVLNAIKENRTIVLRTFPNELWTNRIFVRWAAQRGVFHDAISDEFASDQDICLLYYRSSDLRKMVLSWISESLKSDRDFVLKCLRYDSLILETCSNSVIWNDFEVVLHGVLIARWNEELDWFVASALEKGFADYLIAFAKTLRAKVEAHCGFQYFTEQVHVLKPCIKSYVIHGRIGSYLGIDAIGSERRKLYRAWSNRSIFFLALGGNFRDLCEAHKFRTIPEQSDGNSDEDFSYFDDEYLFDRDFYDSDSYDHYSH